MFIHLVPIDGMWTLWSSWGQCTNYIVRIKACDIGERMRSRSCTNPPPKNNGAHCVGPRSQIKHCYSPACPDHSGKKSAMYQFFE